MSHTPILVEEIIHHLKDIPDGLKFHLDGTFGRGGHLRAVLEAFPEVKTVALDKDLEAVAYARKNFEDDILSNRLKIIHADFHDIKNLISEGQLSVDQFDSILLDLGVSSPQLDVAQRGFSFLHNGPLDMRMNQSQSLTAKDLINTWSEDDLKELFKTYGETHHPSKVARAIVHDRQETPFETTQQLASLIERVEGWKKKGFHPATQYFMALRIEVNNELEHLETALKDLMSLLREGGRLCVLTFHSLEDRIVKQVFQSSLSIGIPVNKRVIVPSEEEQKVNPRSRSAKLRVFERTSKTENYGRKKDKYAHKKGI